MRQENVFIAESNTKQISIPTENIVQEDVPPCFVGIKVIQYMGKQDVYNMEVNRHHNFLVNGGIVVHNCMDATRYFVNTVIATTIRAKKRPEGM